MEQVSGTTLSIFLHNRSTVFIKTFIFPPPTKKPPLGQAFRCVDLLNLFYRIKSPALWSVIIIAIIMVLESNILFKIITDRKKLCQIFNKKRVRSTIALDPLMTLLNLSPALTCGRAIPWILSHGVVLPLSKRLKYHD